MGNIRSSVSQFKLNSAASTNATLIKAGTGQIYSIAVSGHHATLARYLKVYDNAVAPTVGTTIPILTVGAPPLTTTTNTAVHLNFGTFGISYTNGLAIAITGVGTDADATAVALGDLKVVISYA